MLAPCLLLGTTFTRGGSIPWQMAVSPQPHLVGTWSKISFLSSKRSHPLLRVQRKQWSLQKGFRCNEIPVRGDVVSKGWLLQRGRCHVEEIDGGTEGLWGYRGLH
ncbi:hypothetical protein AVEN_232089-1 [Araneus ventricosus]|uniref:Uncharacterized protein n=1 Tax=Araneus ventricosus TaxID=182803 RepID=A0A4Y2QWJ6_ARAVE|nr:hypothetical protein AVEN_232089-1 [Araneus ventricosus]